MPYAPTDRRARSTKKRRPAIEKVGTIRTTADRRLSKRDKLTNGLHLGDRSSSYRILNEAGEIVLEHKLATTPEAMKEIFASDAAKPDGPGAPPS